ncbi:MAG: hypothetical protein JO233_09285 [Candidatus Eremiobacteraeota bacterium]|nr:hypothetical protein [Candidatus Eremiobacteraeota bacterium]
MLAGLLLASTGCSVVKRFTGPKVEPTPPTLASLRGVSMPLAKAVRGISFRPFVPSMQIIDVALVAPLRKDDTDSRANRGIAFEYVAGGQALLLSEWPRHGHSIEVGAMDIGSSPCQIVKFKPDGAMWSNHRDLLMTLQPDGNVKPPRVFSEARRLLRSGACG